MRHKITYALLAVIATTSPVMSGDQGYVCTDGFSLRFESGAIVTNKGGVSVKLPDCVFTGEDNVFTPSGTERSCDGQTACAIGICDDSFCTYDVGIGSDWGRCIARNTFEAEE